MREPLHASTRINLEKVEVLLVDDSVPSLNLLSQVLLGFGIGNLTRADSAKTAQTCCASGRSTWSSAPPTWPGSTATSWSNGCAAAPWRPTATWR